MPSEHSSMNTPAAPSGESHHQGEPSKDPGHDQDISAGIGGLPKAVLEKLRRVFAAGPGIERVILYGSRAKGTHRKGSDIDITILGESLDFTALLSIETEIDDLMLPYMMDVSLFHHLDNGELIEHIRRRGITIYESAASP